MSSFIISDVRLFNGDTVIDNTLILVENGLITQVGSSVPASLLDHLPRYSKPGHTLLPGLIDAHSHPYGDPAQPEQAFRFGITTLMDLHNTHDNAVQQKQWANERKDFPDIKSCHFAATIDGGWPWWVEKKLGIDHVCCTSLLHALTNGADYIKLMHESGAALGIPTGEIVQPRAAVQAAVVRAAHAHRLKVIAHALSLSDTLEVLRAGVDGMAHTFFDAPMTPEVIELYKRSNAWVNPTLAAAGSLTGGGADVLKLFSEDERVRCRVAEETVEQIPRCLHMKSENASLEYAIDGVRQLKAAGVPIICGSDSAPGATAFGAYLHIEMYMLVSKAGLSPIKVLQASTSTTADLFGWTDRGRVAPGLKADLLLVEGNPLTDITDLLNIRGIWRDGVEFRGHSGFPLQ
ncbi:hypothetical protein BDV95DRAFT_628662 [Massariosphaeria phaeospora]|uniref:Amidohydrolase-related domain-containing protein n=1 Tax=Massariosphaeria phaeospora TaxID=100035 RepID=A0A7C8MNT6_9PLEO|nr:hypothetical protein BDV95DRAFT_628662 [Massariosphaeria phaeospora]